MHKIFLLLLAAGLLIGGGALAYLWSRFRRFEWMPRTAWRRNLLAAVPVALLLGWWIAALNGLVVIVHLAMFWLLCDGAALFLKRRPGRRYYAGYLALVLTALYLGYGYWACHRVTVTHYPLSTDKPLGCERLRIALVADAHLGTTFDGDGFAAHLKEIAAWQPDVLVIAGDLVDDDTCKRDWRRAAAALAEFPASLGKYFVFGNHDKGYSRRRDFSAAELVRDLDRSGVRVLQDASVPLTANVTLTGRCDRSFRARRTAAELLSGVDPSRYRILLDHQPADYAAEAAAGADLVLSGHTHGGQLWPLGVLSRRMANDHLYGLRQQGRTAFIVTSGISDWALDFKTGCRSEFVIIDLDSGK